MSVDVKPGSMNTTGYFFVASVSTKLAGSHAQKRRFGVGRPGEGTSISFMRGPVHFSTVGREGFGFSTTAPPPDGPLPTRPFPAPNAVAQNV